jgi:hypothetical protein
MGAKEIKQQEICYFVAKTSPIGSVFLGRAISAGQK